MSPGIDDRELDPDRGGIVRVVLDLGVGQAVRSTGLHITGLEPR
jgi:hypothetical protein